MLETKRGESFGALTGASLFAFEVSSSHFCSEVLMGEG